MARLLPLQVFVSVMRTRWKVGDIEKAVALAKAAAPYLHGKAPQAQPSGDLTEVSDEELDRAEWDFGETGHSGGGGKEPPAEGAERSW